MITKNKLYYLLVMIYMIIYSAAEAQEKKNNCFEINMTNDGKEVEGPNLVTFLDKTSKQEVNIREGKFCVPESMTQGLYLDVMFVAGKERFYLQSIPIERFILSWDIEIGKNHIKKRFSSEKHVNPKKNCVVIFHSGEPEVGALFFPCRIPLIQKSDSINLF
jgi:hypothetical protein